MREASRIERGNERKRVEGGAGERFEGRAFSRAISCFSNSSRANFSSSRLSLCLWILRFLTDQPPTLSLELSSGFRNFYRVSIRRRREPENRIVDRRGRDYCIVSFERRVFLDERVRGNFARYTTSDLTRWKRMEEGG